MARAIQMVSPDGTQEARPMKAPHIGARAFVRPVASEYAYGRMLQNEGFGIESASTDAMANGWLDAEAGK